MTKKQVKKIKELRNEINNLKILTRTFNINQMNTLLDGLYDTLFRIKSKQIKIEKYYYQRVKTVQKIIENRLKHLK